MVSYAPRVTIPTVNPGDKIAKEPQTIEEKAKQVAVDKYDITGAHIKVPTYFIVKYPNGKTEALHHIRDAKKISDVIRQMHLEEEEETLGTETVHRSNFNGLIIAIGLSVFALLLITTTIAIGVF